MSGEGYFEVAKNPAMPFNVQSKGQEIVVLGTHFNIEAYPDENLNATTLLEGSIKITTGKTAQMLVPGQVAFLKENMLKVSEADTKQATAWKEGKILFHRTDIKKVMREISRWYNIDVHYEGKEPDYTLSGETTRNASLEKILSILQYSDVHFRMEGRTLTITP